MPFPAKSAFRAAALTVIMAIGAGAAATPAMAQLSNSLGASPDLTEEGLDMPDVTALETGARSVPFKPERVKSMLQQAGLAVEEDPAMPAGSRLLVANAEGLVFLYGFSECDTQGCMLLKQVHPIPTTLFGLTMTPELANALNAEFPIGAIISEEEGNVVYRYGRIATPECGDGCVLAHLKIYFASIQELYPLLQSLSGQITVSLEEEDMAGLPAITAVATGNTLDALDTIPARYRTGGQLSRERLKAMAGLQPSSESAEEKVTFGTPLIQRD